MRAHFILSVLAFPLLAPGAHAQWQELSPLPEPNGGFLCGVEGGKLVVAGGTRWKDGTKHWLTAVHDYDPAAGQWATRRKSLPTPVAYAVEVQGRSGFSFLGGSDGKAPLKILGSFVEGQTQWQQLPDLPASMVLACGGGINQQAVFVGGTDDPANVSGVTRMAWTLEKGQAHRLAAYPGKPFAVAASAAAGGELFVFGGMNCDPSSGLPVNTAAAYALAPSSNRWRVLSELPQPVRGLAAVVLDDTHIYLAGGYAADFTAQALVYDVKADRYQPAPPLPYAAMVRLVRLGDFIYCLGGEDKMKSRTDKFFRIPAAELMK